jgi:AcrR family transcriptional regulator
MSTPSKGDRRAEILAEARALLEEEGRAGLTMRALAERLGIRAPSIYKHVAGKEELEEALLVAVREELSAHITREAAAAADPLPVLTRAYRRFGVDHPNLYRLLTERPLPAGHRPGPQEAAAIALVAAATGSSDRARAAWAFAHGMLQLELAGRFPPDADLDAAWQAGIDAFRDGGAAPPRAVVRSWHGPD